jgi:hypothetical protein
MQLTGTLPEKSPRGNVERRKRPFDAGVKAGQRVREEPGPGRKNTREQTMRFLMMHRVDESDPQSWNPSQEFIGKMGAFIQEAAEKDILITAEGVHPTEKGSLVRKARGAAIRVTDGPFAEAKEVIGGFALINAADRAEAVEFAKRYVELFDQEIEVEIRQVVEFDEIPTQD